MDEKSRLLIPAEVRRMLDPEKDGTGFFLVLGFNKKPWLYPDKYYTRLANQQPAEMIPADEQVDFDLATFGNIVLLEWDRQGRVVIPEKAMKRLKLERDLTLVGAKDHCELWPRPEWEQFSIELDQKRKEIAIKARQVQGAGQVPAQNPLG